MKVGDKITFGNYGDEPIDWLVLDVNEERYVLISVKGLNAVPFNNHYKDGNQWETSSIHDWLNGTFYNSAFTEEERANLTEGVTGDKIYLLSIEEAQKYFLNDSARICHPTRYAIYNGIWINDEGAWWWLRSQGSCSDRAAIVLSDGCVYYSGDVVDYGNGCVRPVITLKIN